MAIDPPRTRNIFVYTRLIAIYTVAGLSIILAFMYFCYLARQDPDIASSNGLTLKIGRVAYVYSHGAIQYACGRYDPQLAYILRPGQCKYEDTEYEMAFQPNSAGLRDDEASLDDPDIVILGDSHSLGLGVSQDEIFAALLEKGSGMKVLNTGVSSYGTARELMLFRRLDISNVDTVIIQYCRNDFSENKEYLDLGGRLNIMSQEDFQNNASANNARHRSFTSPGIGVITRTMEKASKVVASLFSEEHEEISEAEAFKYAIEKNIDLLKGKKIIVLEINGHNKYDNLFIENARRELKSLPLDMRFIDVREFLTDEDYYVLDNHMTATGHRKVAKAILDMIREQ